MTTIPINLPALVPALIVALIGWRMVRRVRRLIGRQPVRAPRLVTTAIFFPIVVVLLGLSGFRDIALLEGLAGGVAIGIALAWFGLRMTKFEVTDTGLFYTPNAVIGIVLSVLFIARLIYRFGTLYFATGRFDPGTMQSFAKSPLTLLMFGVLAGYYTAYAIGILRWRHWARPHSSNPRAAPATDSSTQAPTAP